MWFETYDSELMNDFWKSYKVPSETGTKISLFDDHSKGTCWDGQIGSGLRLVWKSSNSVIFSVDFARKILFTSLSESTLVFCIFKLCKEQGFTLFTLQRIKFFSKEVPCVVNSNNQSKCVSMLIMSMWVLFCEISNFKQRSKSLGKFSYFMKFIWNNMKLFILYAY